MLARLCAPLLAPTAGSAPLLATPGSAPVLATPARDATAGASILVPVFKRAPSGKRARVLGLGY
eukprot:scaffold36008_cov36-Phaeocystis_antarctica.AAC.1